MCDEILEEMVMKKYPNLQFLHCLDLIDRDMGNYEKLCYVAKTDILGLVEYFLVAYVKDGLYWTEIKQKTI